MTTSNTVSALTPIPPALTRRRPMPLSGRRHLFPQFRAAEPNSLPAGWSGPPTGHVSMAFLSLFNSGAGLVRAAGAPLSDVRE